MAEPLEPAVLVAAEMLDHTAKTDNPELLILAVAVVVLEVNPVIPATPVAMVARVS